MVHRWPPRLRRSRVHKSKSVALIVPAGLSSRAVDLYSGIGISINSTSPTADNPTRYVRVRRSRFMIITTSGSSWPPEVANGVFVQWCIHLSVSELGLTQWSGPSKPTGAITFSNPAEGLSFTITPSGQLAWKMTEITGIDSEEIRQVITLAAAKVRNNNSGSDLVYQATMECRNPPLGEDMLLNMFRVLGDQVPIVGSRRLSDVVLLDFTQDPPPESGHVLFVPNTKVTATLFVPGPAAGPLAQNAVGATFEVVAAICSIALGRPVAYSALVHFPIAPERAEAQRARRYDSGILGLARESISLDIFAELAALGGPDAVIRARNACITIHEAQLQANADIAAMLYVCAIEALITPGRHCKWRKEQVTKRFREAVLILCKEAVDALLAHQNLEEALGFSKRGNVDRQRRALVDHIYDLRSLPTHTGIGPRNISFHTFATERGIRVVLLSNLARAALLAYMQAPMSFLTGHPALQPSKLDCSNQQPTLS